MYSREEIEQAANGFLPTPDETAAMFRQLLAEIARLQARLDAGPSVELLLDWAQTLDERGAEISAMSARHVANRMEAANGK